ncbi:MAG: IPT/TIG domain-containing protein, partial [Bryocella sp.]
TYLSGTGTGPQVTYNYKGSVPVGLGGDISAGLGLAVDGVGNVYATDPSNQLLKEIPVGCLSSSCVLTLGSAFSYVYGVAVDGLGNVYVADVGSSAVKELVAVNGTVPANPAVATILTRHFAYDFVPEGVAVDASGNLFVTDGVAQQLDQILADGSLQMLATGFNQPQGLAVASNGTFYVADIGNSVVDEIPAGGGTPTPVGSGFTNPVAVAVDGAGNVYVSDYTIQSVTKLAAVNGTVPAIPVMSTVGGTVTGAVGIATDAAGNVYVANSNTANVQEFTLGSAPAVNFATPTVIGTSDATDGNQSFEIVNDGNAALTVTAPSTGSLASGEFMQVAGSGSPADCAASFSLAAGDSCNVTVSFTPVGTVTGQVTDAFNVMDNTLNASPSVTQTATLSGTATLATPQIMFVVPSEGPLTGGTQVSIFGSLMTNVTSVTFGGVPATSFQIENDQVLVAVAPAHSSGIVDVTLTNSIGASLVSPADQFTYSYAALSWNPVTTTIFSGNSLGVGVLNATDQAAGTIAYTALPLPGSSATAVTASTVLQPGTYLLTATFTPATPSDGISIVNLVLQVVTNDVFIASSAGMTTLNNAGGVVSPAVAGGGIGAAVDAAGYVWSIDAAGSSVSTFASDGSLFASYSGVGLSGATSLAVDGSGSVWIANSNNTVTELSNSGAVIDTVTYPSVTAPTGVAIDISGNVWIANGAGNSVSEILGGAAPVAPLSKALVTSGPGAKP